METAIGGDFLSPSGNIGCEVHYAGPGSTDVDASYVYCQTTTPPQIVRMTADGMFTLFCPVGQPCDAGIGNMAPGKPTLAYGQITGVGPFRCVSETTGVTCVVNGRGFQISRSSIWTVCRSVPSASGGAGSTVVSFPGAERCAQRPDFASENGDGSVGFRDLVWTVWDSTEATATGIEYYKTGWDANGNMTYDSYPVSLHATVPKYVMCGGNWSGGLLVELTGPGL